MHMFIAYGGEEVKGQELDHGEDLEVLIVSYDEFLDLLETGAFMQAMHTTCIYAALKKMGKLKIL